MIPTEPIGSIRLPQDRLDALASTDCDDPKLRIAPQARARTVSP